MWHEHSKATGPAEISGASLRGIWDVKADRSYDVQRRSDDRILLAVRTLAGLGRLDSEGHGRFEVGPESLLVLEGHRLRRYRCVGTGWDFHWFEFSVSGPLHAPLHRVMQVPADNDEAREFRELFATLRRESFPERCVASAVFAARLYRWLAHWQGERRSAPHAAVVTRIIDLMHQNVYHPWPVSEMAAEANMSERLFRDVFRTSTGQSPKRFHSALRLALADDLLRLGIYTVTEVANRLNYSSPFHLSKAYKRHFGVPPSAVRFG